MTNSGTEYSVHELKLRLVQALESVEVLKTIVREATYFAVIDFLANRIAQSGFVDPLNISSVALSESLFRQEVVPLTWLRAVEISNHIVTYFDTIKEKGVSA
jgi:hypothetical protein